MGVLWNFFLTSLLLTNAVCILHEKRFLRPCTRRIPLLGTRCSEDVVTDREPTCRMHALQTDGTRWTRRRA
jgi:hypothetical protein